jgi:NAD(P)-dependent dehydrogenase (short-subunit alcohol dehydrogenase family)
MQRLQGKVALVTGAGSLAGIGFATARRLLSEGARVVLTDIDSAGVSTCARQLRSEGYDCLGIVQDVTDEETWAVLVSDILSQYGQLDILVNNAGIAVLGGLEKLSLSDWHRQIDVNLTSTFLGCRAALQQMRAQGRGGAIVNVSSVAGLVGMPGASAYGASKGGIRMMTKGIALDCARDGIRVNSVHPGVILTDIQKVAQRDNPGVSDAIQAMIPLGRMGEPGDIAAMIVFLVSDDAKYVTGAEFVVDGGLTAQ